MATNVFDGDVDILGSLRVRGGMLQTIPRSSLVQDDYASFPIPPDRFRVWDAFGTLLPGTSSADDLGCYAGVFGTGVPNIATGDVKAAGAVTRYARAIIQLPPNYVAGESVRIRISGGMVTTVAGVTATVDVECYKSARDTLKSGSDLCATSAQSINSLTFANKDFEITAGALSPGDWMDMRLTVATNDAATATAVIAALGAVELMCDVKG